MLTVLAFSLFVLSFTTVTGKADVPVPTTIYIRADGTVDPPEAPIQRDGDLYTFTDNIYDSLGMVVERDNIVVDGAGYTLQGTGAWYSKGIDLTGRSNVTIKNMEIKEYFFAIWLNTSSSNSIYGNKVTNNKVGIWLSDSSSNSIYGNDVTANLDYGIYLGYSSGNTVSENKITANSYYGIHLEHSSGNSICGNYITKNDFKHIANVGIRIFSSSNNNSISGNNMTNNFYGILLWGSSNNTIYGNDITNNHYGIVLTNSHNNVIYHNNFVENTQQVYIHPSVYINFWDDGYPFGGNYWSDYEHRYPGATELDDSGVWDAPYIIHADNRDRYPLMRPWSPTWGPKIPVEVPFWMRWWFWAIVIAGIAVLAGAFHSLIKTEPSTPTPSHRRPACQ